MAEYTLTNGYVLSDEEIEKRAQEWESEFLRMASLEKAASILACNK